MTLAWFGVLAATLTLVAVLAMPRPASGSTVDGSGADPEVAVPAEFFGITSQARLRSRDQTRLRKAGVGTMRFLIPWDTVEPRPGVYDFSEVDHYMGAAAEAGAEPLPFVFGVPSWKGGTPIGRLISTPEGQQAWRELLVALTKRYGTRGKFWRSEPPSQRGGVRVWQLGNEPNLREFWRDEPAPRIYAELLEVGAEAIRSVDPSAEIAMAGLPPGGGSTPTGWGYLGEVLEVPGIGRYFDYVAPHPYSSNLAGALAALRAFRRTMKSHEFGRKQTLITEIGWMAGGPRGNALHRTRQGQARMVSRTFRRLTEQRARFKIARVLWYAWQDRSPERASCPFCSHIGLLTSDGRLKPSFHAFRRSALASAEVEPTWLSTEWRPR